MLKFAPNPDAAYEMCTIFAPDCRYRWRQRSNYSSPSSDNRSHGSFGIHSTSSTHYKSFSEITTEQPSHTFASSSFPIAGVSSRESENLKANLSNYDRYNDPATEVASNNTFRRRKEYESVIGESAYDYEEENEEDSDEDENEDFYGFFPRGPANITYVLRPTMETSIRNHTTVRLELIKLKRSVTHTRLELIFSETSLKASRMSGKSNCSINKNKQNR